MNEVSKPKPKLQGRINNDTPPGKPKPRLTGAFRHFQDELKQLGQSQDDIITPEKGELVFDDGSDIQDLKSRYGAGLVELNALNLEPWKYANRSSDALYLEELNRDFDTAGGQKSPVLVRKLEQPRPSSTDPNHMVTHEVIAGRRRWEATRKRENKTLICIVRDLSDQDAALEQEMENRRKDPSNYDDARTYKRYLESGLYPNQQALCDHLGVEKTKLSQLLNYTRLPEDVTEALIPMHNISLHTVRILRSYTTHKEAPVRELCVPYVLRHAEKIRDGKLSYKQLEAAFKKLISPPRQPDIKRTVTHKGNQLCSIKKSADGKVTIAFDSHQLPAFLEEDMQREIQDVLSSVCQLRESD